MPARRFRRPLTIVAVAALAVPLAAVTTGPAQATTGATHAPRLIAPAAAAHIRGSVPFSWSALAKAGHYRVSVAPAASFAGALTVRVGAPHTRLLLDSGTWYWRVRADNGAAPWSATRRVVVRAAPASRISAPVPLGPATGTIRTATPTFRWKPVAHRARYTLRLSKHSSMQGVVNYPAGTSGRSVRLTAGAWFWQVRAAGTGHALSSRWSVPRHLVVAPTTDVYPPTRPGPLTVQSVATTAATVAFGASTDRSGRVLRYQVLANGRVVVTTHAIEQVQVPLACGTIYTLAARAVDAAGNRSSLSPAARARTHECLDTTVPGAPGSPAATARTDTSVTLSWQPSIDPGHGLVTHYLVYRDGVTVGGATSSHYTFTGLQPLQSYLFAVRAKDAVGNLSAAATLTATTSRPPQATGHVRPFLLSSDSASIVDAQKHYLQFDQIYPTYFDVDSGGALVGSDQPAVTRWFKVRGVRVMPRVHTEDAGVIESLATDPAARDRLVAEIEATVANAGYNGVNVDFEMTTPTTGINGLTLQQRLDRLRTGYASFIEELAGRLHAAGALLSVDVAADWCSHVDPMTRAVVYCSSSTDSSTLTRSRPYLYDYQRIAQAADEVWLLSWGLHWATSEPGPIGDLAWQGAIEAYFADLFAARPDLMAKLTLGVQLYGFDWSYRVLRTDTVARPGTIPTAPLCSPSSTVHARARYTYTGSDTSGLLQIDWLCNNRIAEPMEYREIQQAASALGRTPVFDPVAGESWYTAPDPDVAGSTREGWFVDAAAVAARANLVASAGWHLGLWRLGNEDQSMWPAAAAAVATTSRNGLSR